MIVTPLGGLSETMELKEYEALPSHSPKLEVPFDDYGGRIRDPHGRGVGRRPPKPRCHLSTLTKLQLVTVTVVVHFIKFILGLSYYPL